MTKAKKTPVFKPELFGNVKSGMNYVAPLKHKKSGALLTDLEYVELLGRKCIEMDKANPNKSLPTKYGYDLQTVQLAKEVCRGRDAGMSDAELNAYLQICIDIDR